MRKLTNSWTESASVSEGHVKVMLRLEGLIDEEILLNASPGETHKLVNLCFSRL